MLKPIETMKKMLMLLLMCTAVISCSKDDNDTLPESGRESYRPADDVTMDAPVMYTANGEIHDIRVIADYLTRRGHVSYFTLEGTTASGADLSSFSLEFIDDKSALRGNQKVEILSRNDSLIMLAANDLTQDSPKPDKTVSDSLINLVELGGPVTECPAYYTDPCQYRKKYPVLISDGKYYIPYVIATVTSTTWVPSPFGVPMEWTETSHVHGPVMRFNRDVVAQLSRANYTDTLVVQTARRALIRQ